MALTHLWLTDFRCFEVAEIEPSPGVTVIQGPNGSGKTSILEAIGLLATMKSFRGAGREALVRRDANTAFVRAEVYDSTSRLILLEAELPLGRSGRIFANRQLTRRIADLAGSLRVSVFSPEDLELVQGAPSGRREFLDSYLVAGDVRMEVLVSEVERVLRHRAALLKQSSYQKRRDQGARSGGVAQRHPDSRGDIDSSFDVWDERLANAGTKLVEARESLIEELSDPVAEAYRHLAGRDSKLGLTYRRSWQGDLLATLRATRAEDLKHQSTSSGPHRDEILVSLDGMPARSQASQGEQRCAALALRLAAHELATEKFGEAPILLLDDVFSELDDKRAGLLADRLPVGQVLLATAVGPPGALSGSVVDVVKLGRRPDRGSTDPS